MDSNSSIKKEQNRLSLAQQKCSKALTIFCGVCDYDEHSFKLIKDGKHGGFTSWKFHVNPKNFKNNDILMDFNKFYYGSFISSIFPEFVTESNEYSSQPYSNHLIRLTQSKNIDQSISLKKGNKQIERIIRIEYLDLFLFPGNIAFYCFKCKVDRYSYDDITLINNYIRDYGHREFSFIKEDLKILKQNESERMLVFGNKLKLFTLVELDQELSDEQESNLLYDIATCSPIGSATGDVSFMKPSSKYLEILNKNNVLSVFDNWKGMCLFDSFTVLFRKGVLNNFVWENAYFNLIFLDSIYIKHYLFSINKKFYLDDLNKQKLEDEFYEFDKYFNFKQISFNFLPQIIYDKVRFGLDIEDELTQLQTSIERANKIEKSRRDKKINDVLTIIALLTVFSIIWDVSEWIDKLFFNTTQSYNIISVSLTAIVLLLLSVVILKNFKKKR